MRPALQSAGRLTLLAQRALADPGRNTSSAYTCQLFHDLSELIHVNTLTEPETIARFVRAFDTDQKDGARVSMARFGLELYRIRKLCARRSAVISPFFSTAVEVRSQSVRTFEELNNLIAVPKKVISPEAQAKIARNLAQFIACEAKAVIDSKDTRNARICVYAVGKLLGQPSARAVLSRCPGQWWQQLVGSAALSHHGRLTATFALIRYVRMLQLHFGLRLNNAPLALKESMIAQFHGPRSLTAKELTSLASCLEFAACDWLNPILKPFARTLQRSVQNIPPLAIPATLSALRCILGEPGELVEERARYVLQPRLLTLNEQGLARLCNGLQHSPQPQGFVEAVIERWTHLLTTRKYSHRRMRRYLMCAADLVSKVPSVKVNASYRQLLANPALVEVTRKPVHLLLFYARSLPRPSASGHRAVPVPITAIQDILSKLDVQPRPFSLGEFVYLVAALATLRMTYAEVGGFVTRALESTEWRDRLVLRDQLESIRRALQAMSFPNDVIQRLLMYQREDTVSKPSMQQSEAKLMPKELSIDAGRSRRR